MSLRSRGAGVVELELSEEVSLPPAAGAGPLYVLLRWRGRPVGRIVLDGGPAPDCDVFSRAVLEAAAAGLAQARAEAPGDPLAHLAPPAAASLGEEAVTVVVATRDRGEPLARPIRCAGSREGSIGHRDVRTHS